MTTLVSVYDSYSSVRSVFSVFSLFFSLHVFSFPVCLCSFASPFPLIRPLRFFTHIMTRKRICHMLNLHLSFFSSRHPNPNICLFVSFSLSFIADPDQKLLLAGHTRPTVHSRSSGYLPDCRHAISRHFRTVSEHACRGARDGHTRAHS